MSNVLFNGLTAVHADSNGILTTSDTCLTPPFCVPIPYTNIAKSQDAAKTASSVTINGNPACVFTSNFAVSQGDAPGACGGIISGTILGMAEFITFSNDIFIEGIPVVRQTDKMVSNNKNTSPMPLQQPGAGKPPDVSDEGPKELDETAPFEFKIEVSGAAPNMLKPLIQIGMAEDQLNDDDEEEEEHTTEVSSNNDINSNQEQSLQTAQDNTLLKTQTIYDVIMKDEDGNLIANTEYVIKQDGNQISNGRTNDKGEIKLNCSDPKANYTLEILDNEIIMIPS